ncbi:hypothetical protein BDV10DRAFT_187788 [Aspergillus recurvatus]
MSIAKTHGATNVHSSKIVAVTAAGASLTRRLLATKSVAGRTELYTVPESLLSPLLHADVALRAPINRNDGSDRHSIPTTISHPELSIGVHSRPKTGCLALNAQREAQNQSPLPTSMNAKQSEELLPTGPHSCQSLDESPDLAFPFQTTAKDLGMKYDCFLEMSNKNFFPTPPLTDLSWNSATEQPILLDEAMPAAGQDEAAPERHELGPDRGEYLLAPSASTEARLSHVLKAVAAAGFESLDSAVVAYYAKSVRDDEWLGQEQRLNRIRRLPVLLKELHLASQGWCQWQRRSFQEQIIKSTEDILIAELRDHLAARGPDPHHLTGGTGQPSQAFNRKARNEADIEAELPNTWTLLTSLSTKYNTFASKHGQSDMPHLVGKFLAASTDLDT